MEEQTGPTSPEATIVSVDEDALVSQVLEIIGGNAAEALPTLGEAEEGQEEGDDSVFFSDEDQDGRDVITEAVCSFGEERLGDGAGGAEAEEENSEAQHLSSGDDEQLQELLMPVAEDQSESEAADQEAEPDQNTELSVQVEVELKNPAEPGEFGLLAT